MIDELIVLDASVAVAALLSHHAESRRWLARGGLTAPHLIDVEIAHVCRRWTLAGTLDPHAAQQVLRRWSQWPVTRVSHQRLMRRMWSLRTNLTAYDATYVALAEHLDATLVTLDRRLAAAPHRARVTVLSGQ